MDVRQILAELTNKRDRLDRAIVELTHYMNEAPKRGRPFGSKNKPKKKEAK